MRARTVEEIKAFADGYNMCFKQFIEQLKGRKSVNEAIKKMEIMKEAVNSVVEREEE